MTLLWLAFKSLRARSVTTGLTVFSIALSMMLLAGVDALRNGAKAGFAGTISQTDLIVGARGGDLPLLLSTVFHIGNASNNISWETYQHFAHHPAVAWTIPISMGDSFHGHRVVATDDNLYAHYRYRGGKSLHFAEGHASGSLLDVVLGAEVAKHLHRHIGDQLVLAHGIEERSILNHDSTPFIVVGILERTSTPIDDALFVTLLGDEAMHSGWSDGTPPAIGEAVPPLDPSKLKVNEITAFLLGTKSRISTLYLEREINTYKPEPLTAIIPAYTLQQLWTLLDYADVTLSLISGAVLVVGLLAMVASLYTALHERRREIATLRAIGLHAPQIFMLFIFEAMLIALSGTVFGIAAVYSLALVMRTTIESSFGFPLVLNRISSSVELFSVATVLCAGVLGMLPAWRAYQNSLIDGLNV